MAAETAGPKVDRGWVQIDTGRHESWVRARDGFGLSAGGDGQVDGTWLYPPTNSDNGLFSPYSIDAIREALITAEHSEPQRVEISNGVDPIRVEKADY